MSNISDVLDKNELLESALTALFESLESADGDFCGEQREWHLPRLKKAGAAMIKLFPIHSARAIEKAKSPYDTV